MAIWTLWHPTYWLSGSLKAITALASVSTAGVLLPLIPQALALVSPKQLQRMNEELELRVEERTFALREANRQLLLEVHERQRATLALQRSEERYRSLVEATTQIIWDTKTEGEFVREQPSWSAFTGQTYEELKGWRWLNAIHPDDQHQTKQVWLEALFSKTLFAVEYRLRRYDGEYRYMGVRAVPIWENDDSIREWIGVNTDITEYRQAEAELQKAREQEKALEKERELNDLKSRFITIASHEFRTPLSTILFSAEFLKNYGYKLTNEKKLMHFERIGGAVRRMTQLLEDVLLIGKNDAGKLQFNPTEVELETFCSDLVEELQISTGSQHQIIWENHCDRTHARLDEKLLRHILTNLLSNAIKYSNDGNPVHLELSCQNETVVFLVKDQGIGIPQEDQQQLFESFHRAQNVGNISGTGLGLVIVHKCVELHSGQITFASEAGIGTTFRVAIPLSTNV